VSGNAYMLVYRCTAWPPPSAAAAASASSAAPPLGALPEDARARVEAIAAEYEDACARHAALKAETEAAVTARQQARRGRAGGLARRRGRLALRFCPTHLG
jgi:hypothetical protein